MTGTRAKKLTTNIHSVAVHIGNGDVIEPGQAIPDGVDDATREALIATGFFG